MDESLHPGRMRHCQHVFGPPHDAVRGTQPTVDHNLGLAQRSPQRFPIQQISRAEFDRHARDSRRAMHSVY